MRYCNQCHRITAGEPLFCNFCGRSYDFKLCPHSASESAQCRNLQPVRLPRTLHAASARSVLARSAGQAPDGSARPRARGDLDRLRLRRHQGAAQQSGPDVPSSPCRLDARIPLVSVHVIFRTSCGDSFPNYSPVPRTTTNMDIKLPNSEIQGSSASAPKARMGRRRKPAHLRGFSALPLGQCWPTHWHGATWREFARTRADPWAGRAPEIGPISALRSRSAKSPS